jgi:hypothetical protein
LRAVQKVIKNLRKKGAITGNFFECSLGGGLYPEIGAEKTKKVYKESDEKIRLHAQQISVLILGWDSKYLAIRKKGNIVELDGNQVRLHEQSVEIYSRKFFYGVDCDETTRKSFLYWNQFIHRLENNLKIVLLKPGVVNFKLVKIGEYAKMESGVAKVLDVHKESLRLHNRDGDLYCIVDKSHGVLEFETVHKKKSEEDMKIFERYLNDVHESPSLPVPSEQWRLLGEVVKIQVTQAHQMQTVLNILMPKKEEEKEDGEKVKKDGVGWYIG